MLLCKKPEQTPKKAQSIISSQSSRVKRQSSGNRVRKSSHTWEKTVSHYPTDPQKHWTVLTNTSCKSQANLNMAKEFTFKSRECKKFFFLHLKSTNLTQVWQCFSCPSETDFQIKAITWSIQYRNKYWCAHMSTSRPLPVMTSQGMSTLGPMSTLEKA